MSPKNRPTEADHALMAHALRLARQGLYGTDPNPRVGCVIVSGGEVVGEGFHARAGELHAELLALHAAGERARGATAYVTLEPCTHTGRTPPCSEALIAAGVRRVVAAMRDPNPQAAGGLERFAQAGIEALSGVLEGEAEALNPGFIKRMKTGLPWVRVKLAMSLDGRTAMVSGESRWITGEAARRDVQFLRARSSAVMTGIGTVLADDPRLDVRLDARELGTGGGVRQPLRVVLDSRLRMPPTAHLCGASTLVFCAEDADRTAGDALRMAGVEVVRMDRSTSPRPSPARGEGDKMQTVRDFHGSGIDLEAALRELARRGMNEIQVEAGPILSGSLLEAGLVDELVIYLAPHLMGEAARGLFHLPGITRMAERINLKIRDIRAVGDDWRIIATLSEKKFPDSTRGNA